MVTLMHYGTVYTTLVMLDFNAKQKVQVIELPTANSTITYSKRNVTTYTVITHDKEAILTSLITLISRIIKSNDKHHKIYVKVYQYDIDT